MARGRIEPPGNPILDTRLLAKALVRTDSYSLVNLAKALGLPEGTHHRALADALHVFHLVRRLLGRLAVEVCERPEAEAPQRRVQVRRARSHVFPYVGAYSSPL